MATNLRRAAGELLVVGLGGTELTGLERAWLRLVRPGGVILFKRNVKDVAQTHALLDEATGLSAPHSVRCVDVEGGTVNRLRDALGAMPSAQAVGAAMRRPTLSQEKRRKNGALRDSRLAREFGELIAQGVKAFGFNTTLAPVVDLALPEAAEVLGSRPPGAIAAEVVPFAQGFLEGLSAQGVIGCGKHFPGLGGATGDTHFVTPEIERTWQQLWNEDLVPYRDLHAAMPMIMMNHAAYPHTPGGNCPASASAFWITNVLRKRIGYRGIILSDDLEMGGILKFLPVDEAAVAAVRAGSDLLEICHSAELILRSYEALISEAERSVAFRNLLLARSREVARKRQRLYKQGVARALTAKQFQALQARVVRFRERIAASEADAISPRAVAPAEIS
ncbi:MAG TPA: beta-N-acetylhexosaminidase [Terracidiphilus sp.]|nr:beta-N-acetylhexosaminidase [Terracidiphilus sp.]